MNKKQLIIALTAMALISSASCAYSRDIYKKDGEVCLDYKGKTYVVKQYTDGWDFKYYSLQYYSPDETKTPEGLVLVLDTNGKVIKEISNSEYCPDIMLYDVNADMRQDLILFWYMGAHSKEAQVWINKDNKDFQNVFKKFNDKNISFSIRNGVPTLAFKKEYPMSATNDNFPDSDYEFYGWNDKTFTLVEEKKHTPNSWWEYLKTCNRLFWAEGDLNNDGKDEQVGIFSQWEGEGWWSEDKGDVICIFNNQNILYGNEIAKYSTIKDLSIKDISGQGSKQVVVSCEFTKDYPERNVIYVYRWNGKEFVKERPNKP